MIIGVRLDILKDINLNDVKRIYINKGNNISSQPPYNYTKVEIDDKYSDCIGEDFNEDLTFSVEKYDARIKKEQEERAIAEYENAIVNKIRERYNLNQELAILRQRDAKPEEFAEYNAYVEQCKTEVKNNLK